MIDPEKKTLTIHAENGDEKEFDILFVFGKEGDDKEYVVFTDYSPSENGGTSLSAASFDPKDPEQILSPIKEEEWDLIYHVLEDMQKQIH